MNSKMKFFSILACIFCFLMSYGVAFASTEDPEGTERFIETFSYGENNEFVCDVYEVEKENESFYRESKDVEPLTRTTKTYNFRYSYSDGTYIGTLKVSLVGYYSADYNTSYVSSVTKTYTGAAHGWTFSSWKSGNTATVVRSGTGDTLTYTFTLSTSGVWSYSLTW